MLSSFRHIGSPILSWAFIEYQRTVLMESVSQLACKPIGYTHNVGDPLQNVDLWVTNPLFFYDLACFIFNLTDGRYCYYNPFVSYAHPPIVRGHVNVYEIGSHIPVVLIDIRGYIPEQWVEYCGHWQKKSYVNLYLKTHVQRLIIAYCCHYWLHVIVTRFVDLSLFNLHDCELSINHYRLKLCSPMQYFHVFYIWIKHRSTAATNPPLG